MGTLLTGPPTGGAFSFALVLQRQWCFVLVLRKHHGQRTARSVTLAFLPRPSDLAISPTWSDRIATWRYPTMILFRPARAPGLGLLFGFSVELFLAITRVHYELGYGGPHDSNACGMR